MKTRSGFVSNSSSSSFVILGFEIPNRMDPPEEGEYSVVQTDCDTTVFGWKINDGGEFLDYNEVSWEELTKEAKAISSRYKIPMEKIKLYTGTNSN